MTMATLELTKEEATWLDNALYELKGLRGWAWSAEDYEAYAAVVDQLDQVR